MSQANFIHHLSHFAFRILVIFLCIAICIVPIVNRVSAVSAGATVTVAGGAIGTAGLPALGALGSLLMPTLGVIGAVLLGAGLNVYITDQSAAQGMTKTQFLEQSLRQWVLERGGSFDTLISTIADGITVSPAGGIALTGAAGALIYQFGNWLYASDHVVDTSGDASNIVLIDSYDFVYNHGYYHYIDTYGRDTYVELDISSGGPVVICFVNNSTDGYYLEMFSPKGLESTVTRTFYRDGSVVNTTTYHTVFNSITSNNSLAYNSNIILYSDVLSTLETDIPHNDVSINDISYYFSYNFVNWNDLVIGGGGEGALNDDVFTGNEQDWVENRDLLKPGDGDVITLQNVPDLIGGAVDGLASGAYTVSVPDYLSALADAYNNALATDATVPLTITDTATGAQTVENVSVASPFEDVAVSNSVAPTNTAGALVAPDVAVGATEAVGVMTPDLTTIFPFCIPFDLARVLNLLAADPVIPQYHVSWEVPYFEDPIEFDIDLTPLDGVMSVARTMETLSFVVGLALATRHLYLRG